MSDLSPVIGLLGTVGNVEDIDRLALGNNVFVHGVNCGPRHGDSEAWQGMANIRGSGLATPMRFSVKHRPLIALEERGSPEWLLAMDGLALGMLLCVSGRLVSEETASSVGVAFPRSEIVCMPHASIGMYERFKVSETKKPLPHNILLGCFDAVTQTFNFAKAEVFNLQIGKLVVVHVFGGGLRTLSSFTKILTKISHSSRENINGPDKERFPDISILDDGIADVFPSSVDARLMLGVHMVIAEHGYKVGDDFNVVLGSSIPVTGLSNPAYALALADEIANGANLPTGKWVEKHVDGGWTPASAWDEHVSLLFLNDDSEESLRDVIALLAYKGPEIAALGIPRSTVPFTDGTTGYIDGAWLAQNENE